MFLWCIYARSY